MNGAVPEKAFEKMSSNEKLWLLYNTMCTRDEGHKKHFKRIYILLASLVIAFAMHGGPESLSAVMKIIGFF